MSVFKKILGCNVSKLIVALSLPCLMTGMMTSLSKNEGQKLVFACMVIPGQNEAEALIWARSIRRFTGRFSGYPIWIFLPNDVEALSSSRREQLRELGAKLFLFRIDEGMLRFPLAGKPFAAAEAEKSASGKFDIVAWTDPDNIYLNEPDEILLPDNVNLGYRPVHHINIGSIYNQPLDEFWSLIYKDCHVPAHRVFPMKPNVEDVEIRPYINAGHLIFRPDRGLMNKWRENFSRLYSQPAYREIYKKNPRYAVFVHQAILSATIMTETKRDEIAELSDRYNYPLNLYSQIPAAKRIKKLNDLVTARYDVFANDQHWNALIGIDEPLKSWIDEQFQLKGVNVLVFFDDKFGANNYLNRDLFEQSGWNVTISGLRDAIPGCDFFSEPSQVPPIRPAIRFDEIVNIDYYDALAIMPATSYYQPDPFGSLIKNKAALSLVRSAANENIPVLTICSGTRVLAAADVIRGKRVLGQPPFKNEYENAGAVYLGKEGPPQIEDSIMTGSRDQYYSYSVSTALSTMIEDRGGRGDHQAPLQKDFLFEADSTIADNRAAWQKTIGGLGSDGGRSIAQTADGGFIITGYTFSQGTGDADILVVKTDSKGNMEWSRTFGGAGTEYGNACTIAENGCLVTGYTTSFGAGSKDVYVIKLDENGNPVWTKTYGGESWDVGMSACSTGNGYMICGFTHSDGAGEEDIYVIKIDENGNELWAKTYGGERFEFGNSIAKTRSGHYLIGATTGTFGGGNSDMYLLEIDDAGNVLWTKSIGGQLNGALPEAGRTPFDWCSQVKVCSDGGSVLVGYSNAKDLMNVFVVKTDSKGNILWGQNFGNGTFYDYGYSVSENSSGEYVVCGMSKSVEDNNDIFIARLDNRGKIIAQKTYGGNGSDFGSDVIVSRDGDIIVTGQSKGRGFGLFDVFVMKLKGRFQQQRP
jgi:putative intracellular protease/amidase